MIFAQVTSIFWEIFAVMLDIKTTSHITRSHNIIEMCAY